MDMKKAVVEVVVNCAKKGMDLRSMLQVLELRCGNTKTVFPKGVSGVSKRYNILSDSLLNVSDRSKGNHDVNNAAFIVWFLSYHVDIFKDLLILPSADRERSYSYSRNPNSDDASRIKTTLGRIMRRQLLLSVDNVRDETIGKLTELLNLEIWGSCENVQRLYGKDIINAYRLYSGSSCMSGADCVNSYLKIYEDNPDTVSLLYVLDKETGKGTAKALLWKCTNGDLLLDRVYHRRDRYDDGQEIITKARDLGAMISDNTDSAVFDIERTVELDITDIIELPYIDSFSHPIGYEKKGERVICTIENNEEQRYLSSTCGEGVKKCRACGLTNLRSHDEFCFSEDCQSDLYGGRCKTCGRLKTRKDKYKMSPDYKCHKCVYG